MKSLMCVLFSDVSKKRSTLSSLASVYHTAGDIPAMVATYSSLIETYPPQHPGGGGGSSDVTGVWMTLTDILLQQKSLQQTAWDMVHALSTCLGLACLDVYCVDLSSIARTHSA